MKILEFTVEEKSGRLDSVLSELSGLSRSRVKKLCDEGGALINGKVAEGKTAVKSGDKLTLSVPEDKPLTAVPENIPLKIVYEDDCLAVIDKPQGMTVHAGNGVTNGTLVNALLYNLDHLSGINGVIRPGIVHRIDKNTSGLLVVAKNDKAHLSLSSQLQDKTCRREYLALLTGELKSDSGRIETYIGRDPKNRTKMAVVKSGRKAITDYKVEKRYEGYTLCRFSLLTGRTHQIRVHAKYLGHPVVGDPEYGVKNGKFKLNGQLLHAEKLEFIHPETGKKVSFHSELPDYFKQTLTKLKEKF
ncbi:MAG: RluA family pseudouridine synthase [Clostridia bacterium]|nr:RluA family pseudouridine synthase [Clostridia bacterium]